MAGIGGRIVSALKGIWGLFDAHVSVVVAALVLLAAVLLGLRPWNHGSAHASERVLPNEYMYLDSARVDSYLGQLKKGDFAKEDVRETTTENSSLGLEVEKVGNATQSRGNQQERSVVVTKSEAERFYELLEALEAHKQLTELDADQECRFDERLSPRALRDGSIIQIKDASLQIPPFLGAYPELRYAGYRLLAHMVKRTFPGLRGAGPSRRWVNEEVFGPVPLTNFETVDGATILGTREERQSFQGRVGKNPRIPMSFSVPSGPSRVRACESWMRNRRKGVADVGRTTVIMPARFANLTGDPSLLSDPLTIVGLVTSDTYRGFGDGLSVSAYWPALRSAGTPFLRQLGVRPRFLKMNRDALLRHLFGAVERLLTYKRHVVVVIPIAIYD